MAKAGLTEKQVARAETLSIQKRIENMQAALDSGTAFLDQKKSEPTQRDLLTERLHEQEERERQATRRLRQLAGERGDLWASLQTCSLDDVDEIAARIAVLNNQVDVFSHVSSQARNVSESLRRQIKDTPVSNSYQSLIFRIMEIKAQLSSLANMVVLDRSTPEGRARQKQMEQAQTDLAKELAEIRERLKTFGWVDT